jgi:uncharacterized iron-regulated membrane protein
VAVANEVTPVRDLRPNAALPKVVRPDRARLDIDAAVATAGAAVTEGRLRNVIWPQRPDQPLRVGFSPTDRLAGAPPIVVLVDPWSPRVLEIRDPRNFSAVEAALAWMRPLHAGEGLGAPWRLLVFVSGMLPPLFAISGVAMWVLRRRRRRAVSVDTVGAVGD